MINVIYMIMPIITMIVGFYFGYRIGKDKEIPDVKIKTPVEVIEEMKERHEEKTLENEIDNYISNIDNYPNNQRVIK